MDAFPSYRADDLVRLSDQNFLALEIQAARIRRRRIADQARATALAWSKGLPRALAALDEESE